MNTSLPTRALVLFVVLLGLWWLVPFGVKTFGKRLFFEFQAPSLTASSYLKDLQDYWVARQKSEDELIQAGVDLARLNAAYTLRNQEVESLQAEVARLEEFLDLPPLPEHRYEVARVMRRDLTNWWQTFTIRKGEIHGLRPGYAVVYKGGVVGRVREVHAYTAVVELLTSPAFRVAAHFEGDLRPVQFQGGQNPGLAPPVGKVSNAPADIEASPERPRRLVSSRLGGVFPDGLFLGTVDNLEPGPTGLFRTGSVIIDPRLTSLREVAVLIPFRPDDPTVR